MAQSLTIIKNGEDISGKGIRDSEKILSEEFPDINIQLLSNIVILGQGLPSKFTGSTPSGRKEALEKLFKADFMIEDIKSRINNRLSVLKTEQRDLEDSILSLNSKLSVLEGSVSRQEMELLGMKDISEYENIIEEVKKNIFNLTNELEYKKQKNEDTVSINASTNELILALTQEKVDISNSDFLLSDIEDIKTRGTQLKGELIALEKEIQQKDNIKDICPTCGQKLIGVEKPDTSKEKEKSMDLQNKLSELRTSLQDIQNKRNNELNKRLEKVEKEIIRLKTLIQPIENVDAIERELSAKNNELINLNNEVLTYNTKKNELESSIKSNNTTITQLREEKDSLENKKIKLDAKIDIVNKINTIIKRDFRGYLLSNIISLLDTTIKEYSKDIFNHSNVCISQDGNSISVKLNDKEYEQLSGGERTKIDILLQLSLREVLTKYTNIHSNILAIDEIFDGLDELGSENILNLVSTKLNIPSVYIVTHRQDFDMPMDNRIIVRKTSAGSTAIQQ